MSGRRRGWGSLLAVLEQGGFDVHLRTDELRPLVTQLERIGNRLVAGTIAAAHDRRCAEGRSTRGGRCGAVR